MCREWEGTSEIPSQFENQLKLSLFFKCGYVEELEKEREQELEGGLGCFVFCVTIWGDRKASKAYTSL